jgi:hypothetical protein
MISAVQAQFPYLVFTLTGPVDAHHRQARFSWSGGLAGAEPIIVGFDVALAAEDGRLARILGFFDKVPA